MPKLFTVAAVAPSAAPTEEGLYWVDSLARKLYFAVGTAAVSDWLELATAGAGSAPKFDKILLKNGTDNLYYEVVTETPPDGFGGPLPVCTTTPGVP